MAKTPGYVPTEPSAGSTLPAPASPATIDENDAGSFDLNGALALSNGTYSITSTGRGTAAYDHPEHLHRSSRPQFCRLLRLAQPSGTDQHRPQVLPPRLRRPANRRSSTAAFRIHRTRSSTSPALTVNGNPAIETGRFTLSGASHRQWLRRLQRRGQSLTDTSFSGTYTAAATGRWQANLNYSAIYYQLGISGLAGFAPQSTSSHHQFHPP